MKKNEFIETEIKRFDEFIQTVDKRNGSYGGGIRSEKGSYLEFLVKNIIKNIFLEKRIDDSRWEINSKKINISLKEDYLAKVTNDEKKEYIKSNMDQWKFGLSVDVQVWDKINEKLIFAIECKNYTENAMIKRVCWDMDVLKENRPEIKEQILIQLESMLGGDFSKKITNENNGSPSTHIIMSYFSNLDLKIFTLVLGERKVTEPIHKVPKQININLFNELYDFLEVHIEKYWKNNHETK